MVTGAVTAHAASLAHKVMWGNDDLDRVWTAHPAEAKCGDRAAEPKKQPLSVTSSEVVTMMFTL
jgi:hypothetical protein